MLKVFPHHLQNEIRDTIYVAEFFILNLQRHKKYGCNLDLESKHELNKLNPFRLKKQYFYAQQRESNFPQHNGRIHSYSQLSFKCNYV